jgi:hypothetical protein
MYPAQRPVLYHLQQRQRLKPELLSAKVGKRADC